MGLTGGSALRARLTNVKAVGETFTRDWAEGARDLIAQNKPASKRPASSRFGVQSTPTRGGVYGAYWWIFVDRGTKAHVVEVRKKQVLSNQQTIFGRRALIPRISRRPFISRAAQQALRELGSDAIIQAWNGRRRIGKASHSRFL